MRWAGIVNRYLVAAAAVAFAALTSSPAGAGTFTGDPWGQAQKIPGFSKLNTRGYASFNSVSCASPGNCGAGGQYTNSKRGQAFVVSQVNGVWGQAEQVPGIAELAKRGFGANTESVSCASAGNCSAGGYYTDDATGGMKAFVVSEVNGVWGQAEQVPGTAGVNLITGAKTESVSCRSAGNCSAGGYYTDSSGHQQTFVVSEVNGVWGTAEVVPGTESSGGSDAQVLSVSCASVGNCVAGGAYDDQITGLEEAFVVSEVNGAWGTAEPIPGLPALGSSGALVYEVSCPSAGNCSAVGAYSDSSDDGQGFVASQVNGVWQNAEENPGPDVKHLQAETTTVSCASAGNCVAGGQLTPGPSDLKNSAFVIRKANGVWGKAEVVPGTIPLNVGGNAAVDDVSCGSVGNCSLGGYYANSTGSAAFVAGEVNGVWSRAEQVPGTSSFSAPEIDAISCASASDCTAGGIYQTASGATSVFVVSRT